MNPDQALARKNYMEPWKHVRMLRVLPRMDAVAADQMFTTLMGGWSRTAFVILFKKKPPWNVAENLGTY